MPRRRLTFLFTDIEGSTRLVSELGDRFGNILAVSRAIVRKAVIEHGGRLVEARADESFAVFPDAGHAVAAAVEAQRSLAARCWGVDQDVRVRMGLHTGYAWDDNGHLIGLDVHRASRISDSGHGGQILASAATVEAAGIEARELGEYSLHGLTQRELIFQVEAEGLPTEFPCLRSAVPRGVSVVLADDSVLVREGIARVLSENGMEVVAQAGTADELLDQVAEHEPAVAIVDIRMPPGDGDEGLRAAKQIRAQHPDTGVLLLSQQLEPVYAAELREGDDGGVGYLLKDRVADLEKFAGAVLRISEGEQVFDPLLTRERVTA
jgi:class 3 adenylate cyclase/CheY-like chemotaxis protein